MRKYLFLLFSLLSSAVALAGNGDDRITVQAGVLYHNTLNAAIGYEHELPYGKAFEIYGEAGNKWHSENGHVYRDTFWKDYYWDGGFLYKVPLRKFKNSMIRVHGGMQFGAHTGDYFFGGELGLEYNYNFANGMKFIVTQKNQVNFLHGDNFRNGLLIGLALPL